MKKTQLVSMLMSFGMACSAFIGCSPDKSNEENNKESNVPQKTERRAIQQPLTLLGKRFIDSDHFSNKARLYFDLDGNTNTTEVIATIHDSCEISEAHVFDAKIGDRKTQGEWVSQLSHKDPKECTTTWSGKHPIQWVKLRN